MRLKNIKHTHNPTWMKTNQTNQKLKKFRIDYYLLALVFELLYSLFCCKFWLFQTLISHIRWCSTEENLKRRVRGPYIFRVEASHQNHVVVVATISKQLWVTFLDYRECGRLGQRCWTTSDKLPQLMEIDTHFVKWVLWMLWVCKKK